MIISQKPFMLDLQAYILTYLHIILFDFILSTFESFLYLYHNDSSCIYIFFGNVREMEQAVNTTYLNTL